MRSKAMKPTFFSVGCTFGLGLARPLRPMSKNPKQKDVKSAKRQGQLEHLLAWKRQTQNASSDGF